MNYETGLREVTLRQSVYLTHVEALKSDFTNYSFVPFHGTLVYERQDDGRWVFVTFNLRGPQVTKSGKISERRSGRCSFYAPVRADGSRLPVRGYSQDVPTWVANLIDEQQPKDGS